MSELLPSAQAREIRDGLLDYLTTTFALADPDARTALAEFLGDPGSGIFKGPYLRLRLPFRAAADGWQSILSWDIGITPYGHQAEAFARLVNQQPTLVTTGTGSGKTEAFLYPILDHVLKARRDGVTGMKALILYPMNALANDQAKRLAELLTTNAELAGVTAALYTGQDGPRRTKVSADGLITEREIIRDEAPDILLTNYKMLDQLLLRHDDRRLWKQSASSLRYLVLDEFHTYDGAQGTDVAMLLRRLGLTLEAHAPGGVHVTPVATSATLGDQGDPAAMIDFARTVFGTDFDASSVVTESRLGLDEWAAGAAYRIAALGLRPRRPAPGTLAAVNSAIEDVLREDARERTRTGLLALYDGDADAVGDDPETLLTLVQGHPLVQDLVRLTEQAVPLADLAEKLLPGSGEDGVAFLTHLVAALSHVRVTVGRAALGVDLHLWVRELTRIDRVAASVPRYRWSDDGTLADLGEAGEEQRHAFPAIYCRHCGRSGWGIGLAAVGSTLDANDGAIRGNHARHEGRFRALIHAPKEAEHAAAAGEDHGVEGLRWFDTRQRELLPEPPSEDDENYRDGWVLPVLTQTGTDADGDSKDDICPSCLQKDGIRFLGSAIATLLSVTLSTMFGDQALDAAEKKALVFTDSVQDAAHRAGFVGSRSHVLTLRAVLRRAAEHPITLDALVDQALANAGDDRFHRYRIIPPDLVERDEFRPFWQETTARKVPARIRTRVKRRLLFDAVLEFGLQSRVGRTLEQTGSAVAEVDAGEPAALAVIARAVLNAAGIQDTLDEAIASLSDRRLVAWVRGVLEHMRTEGAIEHEWFDKFVRGDGDLYRIWTGRPKDQGMPAFPKGRATPAFPRTGPSSRGKKSLLDSVGHAQSWYARWTARTLGVTGGHGARLAVQLLDRLAKADVLRTITTDGGGTAFAIPASSVVISPTELDEMRAGANLLACSVCRSTQPGPATVIDQLDGAPCLFVRCPGVLRREPRPENYYRRLYASADMRRIVSREHSSLLDDETRLKYETEFKQAISQPSAPNVLVATPTLEMGIDIGDLSAVLLSSLPRTVASYLQRVGRAGRLTGSALNLAFVTGRGEQLLRLEDPLSVINGQVRAPATYLSAEEILRRQYVAHLVDCFARDEHRPHPRRAKGALGSAEPGTFLGDLITFAEGDADGHLERFLGSLDTPAGTSLADTSVESLRAWASPAPGEPRTSRLAAQLYDASRRWNTAVEGLSRRRTAIEQSLPELKHIAGLTAASDDDKRALRIAQAARQVTMDELRHLQGEYWIAVLEEFGILPNYTLLGDLVTLDVAVTWIDPETQEYQSKPETFQRASANALREFAPGATFYARGLEIYVDAIDLGHDDSSIRTMAFCPGCGYALDLGTLAAGVAVPSACPRCGAIGLSGTENRLDVVELSHVSAQIRREEAVIGDRHDERKRESYVIATAADIDPAYIAKQWYLNDYDFGTKYLRQLTVRWVNLGRQSAHGASHLIAGHEGPAPLFRVCAGCGMLDKAAGKNLPDEHRAWCRYRKSQDEHIRTIALTRTLTTQGAVIRLPQSVTVGDRFAIPSLAAAVLLGLHEQIGGSPDHIDIAAISEPVKGHDGATSDALLLHDVVPGGTGYLAELANAERMHDLLHRAWIRVRDCPCQYEGRLACHRCLLPFARISWLGRGDIEHVSRATAERGLRAILTCGGPASAEPAETMDWSLTTIEPPLPSPESHLEQSFRKVFGERVSALGATVKETPGPQGNRLSITHNGRQWLLEPQVQMSSSRPDFMLRCTQGGLPDVAIFTDGWQYHASPGRNRLADDARKRQDLRDGGNLVLAVTAQDVDGNHEEPSWLRDEVIADLMSGGAKFRPRNVEAVRGGPIRFLLSWIENPDVDGHRELANHLPFMFVTEESLAAGAEVGTGTGAGTGADGEGAAWRWSSGAVTCTSRARGDVNHPVIETELVIDNRDPSPEEWREWLRISNALSLRDQPTVIGTLTEPDGDGPAAGQEPLSVLNNDFGLGSGVELSAAERRFLTRLGRDGSLPTPVIGHEVDGVPIDFAWPDLRVAVFLDPPAPEERRDLERDGWRIFTAADDPDDINDALRKAA